MQFTVYFEHPFWVGVLEVERNGTLYAARHVFGAEPSNQAIYEFVCHELDALCARLTIGVKAEATRARCKNPKRVQREIRRELAQSSTTTKAHDAMRRQIEQQNAPGARSRKRHARLNAPAAATSSAPKPKSATGGANRNRQASKSRRKKTNTSLTIFQL